MKNRKFAGAVVVLLSFRIFLLVLFTPPCCSSDEGVYHSLAKNLVTKNTFIVTQTDVGGIWKEEVYGVKPPLYPFFLAAIYKTFGVNHTIAKVFQIILAVVTGILIYQLTKLFFLKKIAIISLLIFALFWEIASINTLLLSENLYWLLLTMLVYTLFKAIAQQTNYSLIILSGCILGLLTLTRPVSLGLIIPIGFWLFINRTNFKSAVILILTIIFFSLLTITPWTLRNYHIYNQFVFIYTDGNINIWMGNSDGSGGTYRIPKPEDPNQTPVLLTTGVQQEIERNNFYYSKALSYIINNPLGALNMAIRKTFGTFGTYRPITFLSTRYRSNHIILPRSLGIDAFFEFLVSYQFAIFSLSFFLGITTVVTKKKVNKYHWLFIFLLSWHLLSIAATHFEYRYITHMYPLMIPFSAITIHSLLKVFRK